MKTKTLKTIETMACRARARATATASVLVASFLLACAGNSSDPNIAPQTPNVANGAEPAAPGENTSNTSGAPSTAPSVPVGAPCSGKAALGGGLDWKIASGGLERRVYVHLPPGYDRNAATPVVLNFHGLGSNAAEEAALARMIDKSDRAGFIAVHPEGIGKRQQSWNAGACCGEAASSGVDDLGFVGKIIDELESKLCIDSRRVFATGMSNGGFLSHRLACELSTRIAAIAPVAGLVGVASCTPTRPMSVFQFHGKLDALVPYEGNPSIGIPSVAQAMAGWATRSGCSTTPRETSKKGEVTCVTYDGCSQGAEVNLCSVTGGGHTWPGGYPVPSLGHTTTEISATDMMWDFFQRHPRP